MEGSTLNLRWIGPTGKVHVMIQETGYNWSHADGKQPHWWCSLHACSLHHQGPKVSSSSEEEDVSVKLNATLKSHWSTLPREEHVSRTLANGGELFFSPEGLTTFRRHHHLSPCKGYPAKTNRFTGQPSVGPLVGA
eukprot:5812916-Amphidinium_carterae.5